MKLVGIVAALTGAALALSGCGGGAAKTATQPSGETALNAVAARTQTLAVGSAQCATGGIAVETGVDKNGNGSLDSTEVTNTQYVCNGSAGAAGSAGQSALVSMTDVTDPNVCFGGGIAIHVGLDANSNGSLDSAEFSDTRFVCNGSDAAPSGPTGGAGGGHLLLARGGQGTKDGGYGGDGGYFDFEKELGRGRLAVLTSGAADASFANRPFTPSFGPVKLTVSSDMALPLFNPAEPATYPAAGSYYTRTDDYSIFKAGDSAATATSDARVTGLEIAAGATLTLALNGTDTANLTLDRDMVNNGVLKAPQVDSTLAGSISLVLDSYAGGGTVDLKGNAQGQDGGSFYVECSGMFVNSGDILTLGAAGAEGADAGDGGYVDVYATYYIENSGSVDARGGLATGAAGLGGAGGDVDILSDYADLNNSGSINTTGGNGVTGGGDGGYVDLTVYYSGSLRNSGRILAFGGNTSENDGGWGGDLTMDVWGLDLINSGEVDVHGGDSSGSLAFAGDGGWVSINLYPYDESIASDEFGSTTYRSSRNLLLSGDMFLDGGDSASGNGGDGGGLEVWKDYDSMTGDLGVVELRGYATIDLSGGVANNPGDGGELYIGSWYNDDNVWENSDVTIEPGPIVLEADLKAVGADVTEGSTTPGLGGNGGLLTLDMDTDYYSSFPLKTNASILLSGDVDLSSGASRGASSYSNSAGTAYLYAWDDVVVTGALKAVGGGDLGAAMGYGGNGGTVDIFSDKAIKVSGGVDLSGGYGFAVGGAGGSLTVTALDFAISGSIKADGGDADALLDSGIGGSGGFVSVEYNGFDTSTISCAGGEGKNGGLDGTAFVMGHQVF